MVSRQVRWRSRRRRTLTPKTGGGGGRTRRAHEEVRLTDPNYWWAASKDGNREAHYRGARAENPNLPGTLNFLKNHRTC